MEPTRSSTAHAPLKTVYRWVEERNQTVRLIALALILLTLVLMTVLVYMAGGSHVVYTHGMYVPIVIAGLMFGLRGGMATAVAAGLLLGPLMPLDVETGATQPLVNWGFREVYFLLVAFIIGGSSDLIRDYVLQLRWRWLHNDLSQLLNREALIEVLNRLRVQLSLSPAGVSQSRMYLIDITTLNELSLKLGPGVEKTVISTLATELGKGLLSDEQVFHVRSNRLAILAPRNAQERRAAMEQLIEKAISKPVEYEEIPLLLHCVWSDIELDDHQLSAHDYLRRLEMAINEARSRKLSHSHYNRSLGLKSRENLATLGLLKHALDEDTLALRYQPKYRLSDRKTVSAEALLLWNDPSRGEIPAGEFIPLAEQSMLINPMTLWVIERAARDVSAGGRLHGLGLESVAVNISAVSLSLKGFVESLTEIIRRAGISPSQLEIELTESAMVEDLDSAVECLRRVAALGIKVSIDDFGTGFSSLQYLERLPVSSVKVDQMFIRKIHSAQSTRTIVKSTIELAHSLGLTVVAEGIESQQIENELRELGCDYGQGYHFGRPVSTDQFAELLQASSR